MFSVKSRLPVAFATLIAFILLAGCNSNEQSRVKTAKVWPNDRITPAELKTEMAGNSAIIVDVRGEAAYKESHIKGARQIPYAEIAAHVDELPRDKTIVTYCS